MKAAPVEHFVTAAASARAYPVQPVGEVRFRSAAVIGVKSFSAAGKPTANAGDVFLGVTANRAPIKVESGKFITIEAPEGETYDLRAFWFVADNAADGLLFILTP